MQVVIMAGGEGKRLRDITNDAIPKSLVEINNRPLLDHVLECVIKNDCDDIIICTGYLGKKIEEFISGKNYNASIQISYEKELLGTAGALHLISDLLDNDFFVVYADVFTTINLKKMYQFHKKRKADVTVAVHESEHPYDSTVVKIDKEGRYLEMIEKPGDEWKKYGNLTQTSLYLMKKKTLNFIPQDRATTLEKDIFPVMLKKNKRLFGYKTSEFSKDIGTPQRYYEVVRKLK